MVARTMRLIVDAPLVHEPLDVYDNMHHEMQPLNVFLPI